MIYRLIYVIYIIYIIALGNVYAANDGVVGETSTGDFDVSVEVSKLILATMFIDFSNIYSGTGAINRQRNIRIFVNYGTAPANRLYRVTSYGSGPGGAFSITNGSHNLPYTAWYNDAAGTSGRVILSPNTPLTNQSGAFFPINATVTSSNGNYSIRFTQANLRAAPAGVYTGTQTYIFEPE